VPDEIMFATKPQLAGDLLQHAHDRGIRAGFTVGDEVYGGFDLRKSIRERGAGYVMAVRSNYMVTVASGRYTGTVSSFLCWTPDPVPLAKLIKVAVTRWRIEEDHQLTKQVTRLDSGQVTTWTSWHRRTAISLLACAFLAVAAAWQRARISARACST
jgi:SRSO17 transposase